jgi:aldose 1-epimerase
MTADDPIILSDSECRCVISPRQGAGILEWSIAGQNMLRRADTAAIAKNDPLGFASFPLVPYSNRIGYGRFNWAGQAMQIQPNFAPEPHAVHGTGWKRPWTVQHHDAQSCELVLAYDADENWHWAFTATQRVELTQGGLRMTLSAVNQSPQAVPLAFGHHPYFDSDGAKLTFNADSVWQTGDDGLPAHAETPSGQYDFSTDSPVTHHSVDNGYAGWDGKAQIRWDNRPLMLDVVSDMTAAVVFVPDGAGYFCFEPVPHIINALNLPDHSPQMPVVAAGQAYTSSIEFIARAA